MLERTLSTSEFARIRGRSNTAMMAVSAATAGVAGLLASANWVLPFLANGALAAAGIAVLATFPSPEDDGGVEVFSPGDAVRTLRLQASRPAIRWFVRYVGLFYALVEVNRTFEQPAMEAVGVPVAAFGLLYAGFKLLSAAAAACTGWVHDRLGVRGVFALLAPFFGLTYASIAIHPLLIAPVLFAGRSANQIVYPIRNQYLNDQLDDVDRATVLSGVSMTLSIFGACATFLAGPFVARLGLVRFFFLAGTTIAVAGAVVWIALSPVRAEPDRSPGGDVAPADAD